MSSYSRLFVAAIEACEQRFEATKDEREAKQREIERFSRNEAIDWRKLDSKERYASRFERLGMQPVASRLRAGKRIDFNPLEAIVDHNDLQGIVFFERGLLSARAVARINIREGGETVGYGTGFLISPDLLMTNHHVLPDAETAAGSFAQFDYLVGASGREYTPVEVSLDPGRFFINDADRDYAIVAVARGRAAGRAWLRLIRGSGKATVGETVNILQHPGGERLQIVVRDNRVVNVPEDGFFLQYVADTRPGSSGSPVLNDQWELAGLHHAGVPRRDGQGRILLVDGSVWNRDERDADRIAWTANEGTRVSAIAAHVDGRGLAGEARALWDACFTPPKVPDIWPLLAGGGGNEAAPPAQPPREGMRNEPDGSVSWYFRVNFGPVGQPGGTPPQAGALQPAPPPAPPAAPPVSRTAGNGNGGLTSTAAQAARELFESFTWREPYYDKAADQRDRDAYYAALNWSQPPRRLFDDLSRLLESTHITRITYDRSRIVYLYPAVDLHDDGKLHHVYSGGSFDPVEAIASEIALVAGRGRFRESEMTGQGLRNLLDGGRLWEAFEEAGGAPYNCEHVVPQSWFDRQEPMRGDLHHLFTCETKCNSFRGNTPYWQFGQQEAEMKACGRREEGKFEPKNGKGPVARATLYFLVRYPGKIGDVTRELRRERLNMLLDWHAKSPVTTYELHRNRVIFKAQGNRNPFIDRPEAATEALLKLGFGG